MDSKLKPVRLAIIASHPIQHFVPFYRRLAAEPSLNVLVFFMSDFSVKSYFDKKMGTNIQWEMDLLGDYNHVFLEGSDKIAHASPRTLNNPRVALEVARFNPDVILAYGYNSLTQLRVLSWCRRNNIPIMLISDNELVQTRSHAKLALKKIILPVLLSHYKAFLTTGNNNGDFLRHYGVCGNKLHLSPFTIDEDVYLAARGQRDAFRNSFREQYAIDADAVVVLSVGKLTPGKRPLDIVDAAETLLSRAPHLKNKIQFIVAGDGELREELNAQISKRKLPVKLLGFVNLDVLPAVYCAADILVHPSEVDAHPLTLSEAACIGLPVIVSDKVGAVGPSDIARPGENCIVTPCGDAGAIAAAIQRLADEPQTYRKMSQAAVSVFGELDMDRSVRGLLEAVQYCLAGKAAIADETSAGAGKDVRS